MLLAEALARRAEAQDRLDEAVGIAEGSPALSREAGSSVVN